jgi:SecD/SecF fusion protein
MKTNNLIKTCLGLAFATVLLSGCTPRNTAQLKLFFEADNLKSIPEPDLKKAICEQVLHTDKYVDLSDIQVTTQENIVRVEVARFSNDAELARRLIRQLTLPNKGLQIYETYENTEVFPMLWKLEELIRQKDSVTVKVAQLPQTLNTKAPETLEEIFQARKDSVETSGKERKPFRGIFYPNIMQEKGKAYAGEGAAIGYCKIKDTAAVSSMFREGYDKSLFPRGLIVMMGALDKELIYVYALKTSPPYYRPAMEGDFVASATAVKDEYNPGLFAIDLNFQGPNVKVWADLTRKCSPVNGGKGKVLAIVLDNFVYSAPTVSGEILHGSSQIAGNFDKAKAEEMCERLMAPPMPLSLKLAHMDLIPYQK